MSTDDDRVTRRIRQVIEAGKASDVKELTVTFPIYDSGDNTISIRVVYK